MMLQTKNLHGELRHEFTHLGGPVANFVRVLMGNLVRGLNKVTNPSHRHPLSVSRRTHTAIPRKDFLSRLPSDAL
jgi:hypothetical protein